MKRRDGVWRYIIIDGDIYVLTIDALRKGAAVLTIDASTHSNSTGKLIDKDYS